jgi:histone H3
LETQVCLEVLGNLTDKTLERELPDQELGRLLVTTDFSQSDGTGAELMKYLHATSDL